MKRRRAASEQAVQRAIFQHLRARGAPGVFAFHPANGGYRKPVEAAIMKGLGVTAGAPDVLLWCGGKSFAMELKSEDGRVSEARSDMLIRLSEAGVVIAVCHGIDHAMARLESWQLLKGRIQ